MLTVLLILAVATFVVNPLLIWAAAKIVRIPRATVGRAYAAFGLVFLVSLAANAVGVFFNFLLPIALMLAGLCFVLCTLLIKGVFHTGWGRAAGCLAISTVASLAIAFGLRAVAVEAFFIPNGGMEPTILRGDRILADKLTTRFRPPARGEVVIFHPPHELKTNFIKRVAAVEGDKLELVGDELVINGVSVGKHSMRNIHPLDDMKPVPLPTVVPPGKLFMLGDDPNASLDSRFWGFADANQVIGRAVMIYASVELPSREDLFRSRQLGAPPPASGAIRWSRIGKAIR